MVADPVNVAPSGMVKVYPRRIDLENVDRLRGFDDVAVVETMAELTLKLRARMDTWNASCS